MYIMLVVRPRRKKKSRAFRRTDFWSYIHSGFVLRTKRLKKTVIFNFIQRSSHQLERVNSHFVSFRKRPFSSAGRREGVHDEQGLRSSNGHLRCPTAIPKGQSPQRGTCGPRGVTDSTSVAGNTEDEPRTTGPGRKKDVKTNGVVPRSRTSGTRFHWPRRDRAV